MDTFSLSIAGSILSTTFDSKPILIFKLQTNLNIQRNNVDKSIYDLNKAQDTCENTLNN
jgi:hypothetical protein